MCSLLRYLGHVITKEKEVEPLIKEATSAARLAETQRGLGRAVDISRVGAAQGCIRWSWVSLRVRVGESLARERPWGGGQFWEGVRGAPPPP